MSRPLTIAVVLLGLACTSSARENATPDLAVVRTEIDSLWGRYSAAIVAGDADVIGRLYTSSPFLMESGLPTVRTSEAFQALVKDVLANVRFFESDITPEVTELVGDRVLQFGTYRDVLQSTGKPVEVVFGRFAAVFVRDSASALRVSHLVAIADSTIARAPGSK